MTNSAALDLSTENWDISSLAIQPDEKRRLLLIDDDPSDRALYRVYLKSDKDHEYLIDDAELGSVAEQLCLDNHYDCILLDYMLPDQDGLKILDKLKSQFKSALPVVMLSGHGSERVVADAMRAGAMDYLSKRQVSKESLKRAVDNVIEKSRLRVAIHEQTQRLQIQNEQLKRKHDEIQRFYQTVSHELKTPLTSMKEFVSIILDEIAGPVSEQQREFLGLVLESCDQMSNDVNDLLDVTRLETGKYRIDKSATDLHQIVTNSVAQMHKIAEKKSIKLDFASQIVLPMMDLDGRRIEQVMFNLISNAIKYTQEGGIVHVTMDFDKTAADIVRISVEDNGCGISESQLHQVFERLFQVNPEQPGGLSDSSTQGLGLGLTIAREIVTLHSGELKVKSIEGEGSIFSMLLPIVKCESNLSIVKDNYNEKNTDCGRR